MDNQNELKQVDVVLLLKTRRHAASLTHLELTIDSTYYYELTNYVLLLYNRVVLDCAIILLANSRIL